MDILIHCCRMNLSKLIFKYLVINHISFMPSKNPNQFCLIKEETKMLCLLMLGCTGVVLLLHGARLVFHAYFLHPPTLRPTRYVNILFLYLDFPDFYIISASWVALGGDCRRAAASHLFIFSRPRSSNTIHYLLIHSLLRV